MLVTPRSGDTPSTGELMLFAHEEMLLNTFEASSAATAASVAKRGPDSCEHQSSKEVCTLPAYILQVVVRVDVVANDAVVAVSVVTVVTVNVEDVAVLVGHWQSRGRPTQLASQSPSQQ